jgi:amidohydrolase
MLPPLKEELLVRVDVEVRSVLPEIVRFRHERHRSPELTWQEAQTSQAIIEELRGIPGVEIQAPVATYGVVATLRGEQPGPVVAFRADIDALPITEETGKPYASQTPGVMHACGHDGHTANLLGAVRVLAALRDTIRGTVKFLFQPAEEGGAGGAAMCREGVLEDPNVDAIFGLHCWPELPCGSVGVRYGPLLASSTDISITVRGVGGHAAMPHRSTDQVLIAARIIEGLQTISSRIISPAQPIVVSITKIHAGSSSNVIPTVVEMAGTLRAMTYESRQKGQEAIRAIAEGIATTFGAQAEVSFVEHYPPTINHHGPTEFIKELAFQILPSGHVHELKTPSLASEDFAYYLEKVPGTYFVLGIDDGREGGYPGLHTPNFDFNDDALMAGIKTFVHAALAYPDWREGN